MVIEDIQKRVSAGDYRFTIHSFERCVERGISPKEVEEIIMNGEIIEDYPEDKYGPSCLIYGTTKEGKVLHTHCSIDPVWVITAYDPTLNPQEWDSDFKKRRTKP